MSLPGADTDVIDALVGIAPGSSLDAIRAQWGLKYPGE